jgi:hypothetical protein
MVARDSLMGIAGLSPSLPWLLRHIRQPTYPTSDIAAVRLSSSEYYGSAVLVMIEHF